MSINAQLAEFGDVQLGQLECSGSEPQDISRALLRHIALSLPIT
jgi:hypothetical protein